MRWVYKWSDGIDSGFYYTLMQRGMLKEEDKEAPIGPFGFYFDAFQELSTCRVNSMSLGPIPFTAIVQYSRIYGIKDEDFHYLIRLMDNALIALDHEKRKSKTEGDKTNG